jgi:uracil-DNA glycosylase
MTTYVEAIEALQANAACGWGACADFLHHARAAAQRADHEVQAGQAIYPAPEQVCAALQLTPLQEVKAVILGQDPYPTPGNAHGLAFSVPRGRPIPPSLRTIYRSLAADFGCPMPGHGDLSAWAKRGVLLLNTILTVRAGAPHSHKALGWQAASRAAVRAVSVRRENVVFLLWGTPAQRYAPLIDTTCHGIVRCTHPSPLNMRKGGEHPFIDAHPFAAANAYLAANGRAPINWCL